MIGLADLAPEPGQLVPLARLGSRVSLGASRLERGARKLEMAWQGQRVLAVVPARGGSKGIPRKNLATVAGASLIEHAARAALALSWVDRAVLSTEDEEMAQEGQRCGLAVPFRRPEELASDEAAAADVWAQAWLASEEAFGEHFDVGLWLQPTTPLRRAEDVETCVDTLVRGGFDSVATLSPIPAHLRPERAMTLGPRGELGFAHPAGREHVNRQTIPATYFRNGACYAATRATVVEQHQSIGEKAGAVVVEGEVASIDDPAELAYVDWLARQERGES